MGILCGVVSLSPLRKASTAHNYVFHARRFTPTWHRAHDRLVRRRVDSEYCSDDESNWHMFWRPDEVDEEDFFRALDLVAFDGVPKLANSAADDMFLSMRQKEYETVAQHQDRICCCFEYRVI